MARLSRARKSERPSGLQSLKIVLDRCNSAGTKKQKASGVSGSYGLRKRSNLQTEFSARKTTRPATGRLSKRLLNGKQQKIETKKKNVNTAKLTDGKLNGKRIDGLKRGSTQVEVIVKKAKFYNACQAFDEKCDQVENDDPSTMAKKGRFMNLRNVRKPSFKATMSSVLLTNKSKTVQQPVKRIARTRESLVKPSTGGTRRSRRPSARLNASSNKLNRGSDALCQTKPFIIKLVRLENCLICSEPLNEATHTCKN